MPLAMNALYLRSAPSMRHTRSRPIVRKIIDAVIVIRGDILELCSIRLAVAVDLSFMGPAGAGFPPLLNARSERRTGDHHQAEVVLHRQRCSRFSDRVTS